MKPCFTSLAVSLSFHEKTSSESVASSVPSSLGFTVADLVGEKTLASVLSLTPSLFLRVVGTTSENTERPC